MNSVLTSDIFFFITSAAIIILTAFGITICIYAIKMLRDMRNIIGSVKNIINNAEADVRDVIRRFSESALMRLLFPEKEPPKKKTTKRTS